MKAAVVAAVGQKLWYRASGGRGGRGGGLFVAVVEAAGGNAQAVFAGFIHQPVFLIDAP